MSEVSFKITEIRQLCTKFSYVILFFLVLDGYLLLFQYLFHFFLSFTPFKCFFLLLLITLSNTVSRNLSSIGFPHPQQTVLGHPVGNKNVFIILFTLNFHSYRQTLCSSVLRELFVKNLEKIFLQNSEILQKIYKYINM